MNILNFSKDKKKIEQNFFFLGTLLVILINVLVFVFGKVIYLDSTNNWNNVLDFSHLIATFTSAFRHYNLQHVLLNSLCFLIVGAYVERKQGTIGLLILVFIFALFGESMTNANHTGTSLGFSGVNFAFYAYVIVDFIFTFKQRNLRCVLFLRWYKWVCI